MSKSSDANRKAVEKGYHNRVTGMGGSGKKAPKKCGPKLQDDPVLIGLCPRCQLSVLKYDKQYWDNVLIPHIHQPESYHVRETHP